MGHLVPIGRVIGFPIAFKDFGLGGGMAGTGRKFFISSGLLVANQAIDPGLVGEVEIFVLPPVAGMARCATSLVALDVHSKVVDGQPALSQDLAFRRGGVTPGPVNGFVKLRCSFRMA